MKVASAPVVLEDIVVYVNPGALFAPTAEEETTNEVVILKDVEGVAADRGLEDEETAEEYINELERRKVAEGVIVVVVNEMLNDERMDDKETIEKVVPGEVVIGEVTADDVVGQLIEASSVDNAINLSN